MAVCLRCGKQSAQPGELCSCGKSYTVCDNQEKDPLGLLGRLISDKFVPIMLYRAGKSTVSYELYQLIVDRRLTLNVLRPELYAQEKYQKLAKSFIDCYTNVKQQNTPTLLEVIELPDLKTLSATSDVQRGEDLLDYLQHNEIEPIDLIHIIHQMLQATSAFHRNGLRARHISPHNLRIIRSGNDTNFLRLRGFLENDITFCDEPTTTRDDVADVAQIALSLLTGNEIPVTDFELPADRSYLAPIVQLFAEATANYETCTEMLNAFETAFDLNTREAEKPKPAAVADAPAPEPSKPKTRTPVSFEQIIWMHRPPQSDF